MTSSVDVPNAAASEDYEKAVANIISRRTEGQVEKFRQAARKLGAADESEEAFDRALKKVASAPPAPMPKTDKPKQGRKRPDKQT